MFASNAASFFVLMVAALTATASNHGSSKHHDILVRAAPCAAGSYANSAGWHVSTSLRPDLSCIPATNGSYVPNNGATTSTLCAAGSYQPRAGQNFCYGAPSGRFASQPGMRGVCGACCGWTTTQTNYNTGVVKCSGSTPFSGRASGSGCVSTRQGCDPVATCAQAANGACPDQSFEFVGPAPGAISKATYAAYGLFNVDPNPANAIIFEIQLDPTMQNGSKLNIKATTTSYAATYPFMGGIVGAASSSNDFASGSPNYAYIQGTSQTPTGSGPQSVPNSFPGSPSFAESSIWSYDRVSTRVSPQWINTDGTSPATFPIYLPDYQAIAITGDVAEFTNQFGTATRISFTYLP
ncbi:hypothetical protein MIND_00135000 [Mycena indigotica]|uniref:Uncharacterized protein n=1 Tax=Mycena indigotica TaxID=2126181 RepID=A0A8H6TCQ1_9AGAR|nr:uncharacterized protein MIND_00135000 [Mycena indigotica]KAF7316168.1 hypothetical protein MIND_00135000 [Mycena indigotica]